MKEDDMSEASPRPWRVSDEDPTLVVDGRGEIVIDLSDYNFGPEACANAALIVEAVNLLHGVLGVQNRVLRIITRSPPDPAQTCDRPLEHAAGCECGQL